MDGTLFPKLRHREPIARRYHYIDAVDYIIPSSISYPNCQLYVTCVSWPHLREIDNHHQNVKGILSSHAAHRLIGQILGLFSIETHLWESSCQMILTPHCAFHRKKADPTTLVYQAHGIHNARPASRPPRLQDDQRSATLPLSHPYSPCLLADNPK